MKHLLKQAVQFIGISGIGWLLDFAVYTVLGMLFHDLFFGNMISSWVGVTFVFLFSTRSVFQNNSKIALKWKYLIYILYQCILIFFISKLLNAVHLFIVAHVMVDVAVKFSAIIAKIVVTPVTMTLNFFVMKGIIEKI